MMLYPISNDFLEFEFSVAHIAFHRVRISMVQFICDVLNEKASAYRAATSHGLSMSQFPSSEVLSPRRGRFQRGRGSTILIVNSEEQHHLSLRTNKKILLTMKDKR